MKQSFYSIRTHGLLLSSLTLLLALSGNAQSIWSQSSDGNWGDLLNWSGGVPTIANAVLITNATTKVITVDLSTPPVHRAARRMDLGAPAGSTNTLFLVDLGTTPFHIANSLNLDAGSRLEVSNAFLQLDGSNGGNFNQLAGDILLTSGRIATTNVAVPATNGLPSFRIGRSGAGRATVLGGELVAYDELVIGDLGGASSMLTLSNGLVHVGGILNLGNNPGATGQFDVFGGIVIATNATARLGDDGNGTLSQYAGTVMLDSASVGRGSNSVGRLNLRGGTLQSGTLSIGRFAMAQGTLEVSGGTLTLGTNTLYVGREGVGTAIISEGIVIAETVSIAGSPTATGMLQLRGGRLTTGQLIANTPAAQIQFASGMLVVKQSTLVANGATFVIGNGTLPATLQLDGGTHNFANGIVVSANATLQGSGSVVGPITVLPGGSNQLGDLPAPRLTSSFVNGQLHLSFPSIGGRLYDVLAVTNLAESVWPVQSTLAGNGGTLTYTKSMPASPRFFRVFIH